MQAYEKGLDGKLVIWASNEDKGALHAPREDVSRNDLGEWAIALHGKGTCPYKKVADIDIKCQFTCWILHSETTNRNCDNMNIYKQHKTMIFYLLTIKF